jgi:tetratricopeptide (TPR) repeat protein
LSWAAAAAAAAPVLDGLDPDEQQRVAATLVTPSRVDTAVVDHIEAVLWRAMRQDDALGPQAALDTTVAQRQLVRSLLQDAPGIIRNRLLSLYANMSRFAGWLSFDLGNYPAASDYYETARAAAHEAQDTELEAFVLCNMSHLATWRHQERIGIDHALAAMGWANRTDDRRLQAYAYDVAARAFAMDGQATAALNALDQARHIADEWDGRPTTHVYFFGTGQLASSESTCLMYLGQNDRAAEAAERALATIDGSFVRNLAITSVRLAVCRLRRSRPDVVGGAAALADAARMAVHNRSARLVSEIQAGWRELAPWEEAAEVKDVREQLVLYGVA